MGQHQAPQLTNAARVVRVLHTALLGGLFLCGAMLLVVRHLAPPPSLGDAHTLALVLAGVSAVLLVVAISILRSRVPERQPQHDVDAYWSDATSRGAAIVLWAAIEGAGLIGAVGYFVTGGTAPAGAFVLALSALVLLRPSRLEGD